MDGPNRKKPNPFFDVDKVVSATDCTGLMPALPQTEEEDENYASIYAIHDIPPDGEGYKAGPPINNRSTKDDR